MRFSVHTGGQPRFRKCGNLTGRLGFGVAVVENLRISLAFPAEERAVGSSAMAVPDATSAQSTAADGKGQKSNPVSKHLVSSRCCQSPTGATAGVFSRPLRARDFQRQ